MALYIWPTVLQRDELTNTMNLRAVLWLEVRGTPSSLTAVLFFSSDWPGQRACQAQAESRAKQPSGLSIADRSLA